LVKKFTIPTKAGGTMNMVKLYDADEFDTHEIFLMRDQSPDLLTEKADYNIRLHVERSFLSAELLPLEKPVSANGK